MVGMSEDLSLPGHGVHGDDDAPVAVDDTPGHLLQVTGRKLVDHLQIILVVIYAVAQVVDDDVEPVVVGDRGLTVLFCEIFRFFRFSRW